jgi:translation initiation factor 1A
MKKEVVTEQPMRVRMPRNNQVLGVIEERLGNRRSKVRCSDECIRICRIPGKVRRRVWIKEGNIVLVEPWTVQSKERGDMIWTYSKPQVEYLEKKHMLDWL